MQCVSDLNVNAKLKTLKCLLCCMYYDQNTTAWNADYRLQKLILKDVKPLEDCNDEFKAKLDDVLVRIVTPDTPSGKLSTMKDVGCWQPTRPSGGKTYVGNWPSSVQGTIRSYN